MDREPQDRSPILNCALRILASWENSRHTLDYLAAQEFKRGNLSSEQKAKITEQTANWARGRGAAKYLLNQQLKKPLASLPPMLRRNLELTACQLLFEERTPKEIIVSQAVDDIRRAFGASLAGMANAVLRALTTSPPPWPDREIDGAAHLAARYSHPDWLIKRWLDRWGWDRTQELLNWNNRRPSIWLRSNDLRGDPSWAGRRLSEAGVEALPHPEFDGYFELKSPFYAGAHDLVQAGEFGVQDPSASLAVRLLQPQPGMSILDLCAAPGGKTALLAYLCGDQAQIMAVDSSADRMKKLGLALGRLGITCVEGIIADGRTLHEPRFGLKSYDAVLLDAPCSGLGVLSRRADLRWRRQPKDLPELVQLQKQLMRAAAGFVNLGGTLVYSTCTTESEENEIVVADFLREDDRFIWAASASHIPARFIIATGQIATTSPRDRVDGIYAARLKRQK